LVFEVERILHFTREDVMKIAARISGGTHSNKVLEEAFIRLKGKSILTLDKDLGVYTTPEMKAIEKEIVDSVERSRGTMTPVLASDVIERRTRELYDNLTEDQKKALERILMSRDRVIGIQGDAGTGKTTMLSAAREQLEKEGYTVRGMSFTGKATKELQSGAGIESQTLHSFLPKVRSGEIAPSRREAWFIDEASMVGSRQMGELAKMAEASNARLILVGDTKQLQSIDAGRMFGKLQETGMETVHMKETVRQKDEDYKEIVTHIAERKIDSAFEKMERKGKVHEVVNDLERRDAIVKEFVSKKDYRNTLVVTPLNRDRNQLNGRIREALREKGLLKKEEHTFAVLEPKLLAPADRYFIDSYSIGDVLTTGQGMKGVKIGTKGRVRELDRETQTLTLRTDTGKFVQIDIGKHGDKVRAFEPKFARFTEGDKVVFLNNDRTIGVQNGLTGEIKNLDERGNITVTLDTGKEIAWNIPRTYNYLDHGYAVTDYKSQGQTSKRVIFHANIEKPTSYNSFYVAMTRGKEDVRVYTNGTEKLKEQVKQEVTKRSSLDYSTRALPPIEKAPVRVPQTQIGREGR